MATFLYIFGEIEDLLTKETICEEPVPAMERLAVCLYRLARGDYLHTIGELVSLGTSTVSGIIQGVCNAMINRSLEKHAYNIEFKATRGQYDIIWWTLSIGCSSGAVDGCYLPIKCPKGGLESAKKYHKHFYSIVFIAFFESKLIKNTNCFLHYTCGCILFRLCRCYWHKQRSFLCKPFGVTW